jgi:hypothetical protein
MPDQVPDHVKRERYLELAAVESELRDAYYRSLCGRPLRVLVEHEAEPSRSSILDPRPPSSLLWLGTSCRYATVELPATADDEGRFRDVVAGPLRGDRIVAA